MTFEDHFVKLKNAKISVAKKKTFFIPDVRLLNKFSDNIIIKEKIKTIFW